MRCVPTPTDNKWGEVGKAGCVYLHWLDSEWRSIIHASECKVEIYGSCLEGFRILAQMSFSMIYKGDKNCNSPTGTREINELSTANESEARNAYL